MSSLSFLKACQSFQKTALCRAPLSPALLSRRMNSNNAWAGILSPGEKSSRELNPERNWKSQSDKSLANGNERELRDAYSGRSVAVISGDIAGAASRLDRIVGSSGIAREWWTNRRHKPKGEERRKLASTRWRKRFKLEVGKKVDLVQQIRRRGA